MSLVVFEIDPLPDFLADHTLAGEAEDQRMRAHLLQWHEFVLALGAAAEGAEILLRFQAAGGRVRILLAARAPEGVPLRDELEILLRAHRLVVDPATARRDPGVLEQWRLADPAVVEIGQHADRTTWTPPAAAVRRAAVRDKRGRVDPSELEAPLVVYPWLGPGGAFRLPFEALASQDVPCSIAVLIKPTQLRDAERAYLTDMARLASSVEDVSDQGVGRGGSVRAVDPGARTVARLLDAQWRRVDRSPFLVLVQCAAAGGRDDVARALAATIAATVETPPEAGVHEDVVSLPPPGVRARDSGGATFDPMASIRAFEALRIEDRLPDHPLGRLPFLADAQGVATVFRLPASLRSGVPGIRVRQFAPIFHPGPRAALAARRDGEIDIGTYVGGGRARMPVADLTKHALVVGFTGAGKTVTVLGLLDQLWRDHRVPFLVLESAKQEYRGLLGVRSFAEDPDHPLRIYTLGNETAAPLRLNPFELLPGVRLEAHIAKLQTCFEGAIPPVGPSSSVIAEALVRAYADCGWAVTDVRPVQGTPRRSYPTLATFVACVETVLEERGYEGEVMGNLRAALVGRFQPLLLGGKGRLFESPVCSPSIPELLAGPAILEMNDLRLEDKALVTMFLLTFLREAREQAPAPSGTLAHVTVVEEAHNVLENVASEGSGEGATQADTRHRAVQAFCALLTEIRSFGEGLVIADQSPQKLARDALRNTNLQIAHNLRDASDREAMAATMTMDEDQRRYLGVLEPGEAGIFRTGLERATFLRADHYDAPGGRGAGFLRDASDAEVAAHMVRVDPGLAERRRPARPFGSCEPCGSPCTFRDVMFTRTANGDARTDAVERFRLSRPDRREAAGVSLEALWDRHATAARTAVDEERPAGDAVDAAWCHFVHGWHRAAQDEGYDDPEAVVLGAQHRALFEDALARTEGNT